MHHPGQHAYTMKEFQKEDSENFEGMEAPNEMHA